MACILGSLLFIDEIEIINPLRNNYRKIMIKILLSFLGQLCVIMWFNSWTESHFLLFYPKFIWDTPLKHGLCQL